MQKTAWYYVLDTLSDWETGYILAELNTGRAFKEKGETITVKTFAASKDPVRTAGGITILPDHTVEDVQMEGAALLLLPGAGTWMQEKHDPVMELAKQFLQNNIPVAAICGATVALARAGLLNEYEHTSNDQQTLTDLEGYKGAALYQNKAVFTDRNLITAPGNAPLEFAQDIFKRLGIMSDNVLHHWYGLFKTQKPEHLDALMEELAS